MRLRKSRGTVGRVAGVAAVFLVASTTSVAQASPGDHVGVRGHAERSAETKCADLLGMVVPAAQIDGSGLSRNDATVTDAVYKKAADAVVAADGAATIPGKTSSVITPAKPDFCQVTGTIAPTSASAQPIGFQVNLPTDWNGSAAQFGGGGFNGVLRDASGYISIDTNAGDVVTPLMRGYLTASTDGGHLTTSSSRYRSPDPVERANAQFDFALDEERFRNFAVEAYPKVKDVAAAIGLDYYGRAAATWLWFGGSEGGREGLLMAQRFPEEFDGIFVRNPVIGWTGLFSNFIETLQAVERDDKAGAFTTPDIELLARTSIAACDELDGVEDGVIDAYQDCQKRTHTAVDRLLCTGGVDPGRCFTRAQLRVIDVIFRPLHLGFTQPSGLSEYPGFFFGGEAWSMASKVGNDPTLEYGDRGYANYLTYAVGAAKFVFGQDHDLDAVNDYDRAAYRERLGAVSRMMDTVDPDLSRFRDHGGKLIVLECTNDYAQSGAMGMRYHDSVVDQLGMRSVQGFMRTYVSAGTDHGCAGSIDPTTLDKQGRTPYGTSTSPGTENGVPRNVDWVSVLERWVIQDKAPGRQVVATANEPASPYAVLASKPTCAYPLQARYRGGDPTRVHSYTCVR